MDKKNITILCKVVDNFGDIGFVYRLARALTELDSTLNLRLVVSDLNSFSALAPQVDPSKAEQVCGRWQIFDWSAADECTQAFSQNPPAIILECFQCGRPDWLETLLFDTPGGTEPLAYIVNIDYLTAEDYADEFHLLKSGTRSARVKKINFMPGFTEKTGGLVLDRDFMQNRAQAVDAQHKAATTTTEPRDAFTVAMFSYERDFAPVVEALAAFQKQSGRKVRVLVAAGKSHAPFMEAWERAGKPVEAETLPFLPQQEWDALLCRTDFNFVRGEDSLSRACLTGVPFVWQAYIQDEDYHLVKLAALNERLRPYLDEAVFCAYDEYTRAYNVGKDSADGLARLLLNAEAMRAGFVRFADDLVANGNLAAKLLAWIEGLAG